MLITDLEQVPTYQESKGYTSKNAYVRLQSKQIYIIMLGIH